MKISILSNFLMEHQKTVRPRVKNGEKRNNHVKKGGSRGKGNKI